jgi:hypothetical protein
VYVQGDPSFWAVRIWQAQHSVLPRFFRSPDAGVAWPPLCIVAGANCVRTELLAKVRDMHFYSIAFETTRRTVQDLFKLRTLLDHSDVPKEAI